MVCFTASDASCVFWDGKAVDRVESLKLGAAGLSPPGSGSASSVVGLRRFGGIAAVIPRSYAVTLGVSDGKAMSPKCFTVLKG